MVVSLPHSGELFSLRQHQATGLWISNQCQGLKILQVLALIFRQVDGRQMRWTRN